MAYIIMQSVAGGPFIMLSTFGLDATRGLNLDSTGDAIPYIYNEENRTFAETLLSSSASSMNHF